MTTTRRFLATLAIAITLALAGLMAAPTSVPDAVPDAVADQVAMPGAEAHHVFACNINAPTISTYWGCAKFVQSSASSGYGYVQDRTSDGSCVNAYVNRSGGLGQIWEWRDRECTTSPEYFTWSGNPSASPQYRICRNQGCQTGG